MSLNPLNKAVLLFILIALYTGHNTYGQFLPVHPQNVEIYQFLDEMANLKVIQINTAIKPYSGKFIAERLIIIQESDSSLNKRQKSDLAFFMREYRFYLQKDIQQQPTTILLGYNPKARSHWNNVTEQRWNLISYEDSLFKIRINPIYGQQYWFRDDGNINHHRWNGAEAAATVGNWGFYGSWRDNFEDEYMNKSSHFTLRYGVPTKAEGYAESRGGITYSWKWGNVGLVKDHIEWGTNQHGANIFGGRNPSVAHFRLDIYPAEWFEFNFIHGQLVSDVLDSVRSYYTAGGHFRPVMRDKYISANLYTAKPTKWLQFSLGNSVIYSDKNHLGYLIPLYFFKSVDHTLNSMYILGETGQNSQLFVDLSLRPIKGVNLYGSLFIDEIQLARITDTTRHNFESFKGGLSITGFPVRNLDLVGEYTLTSPMTYTHNITTTTFETNSYNLGHYLRDNSQELFLLARYRPFRQLAMEASYCLAQHGTDTDYATENPPDVHDWLNEISWQQETVSFSARWQPIPSGRLLFQVFWQNATGNVEKYNPEFLRGKHWYVSLGAGFGL